MNKTAKVPVLVELKFQRRRQIVNRKRNKLENFSVIRTLKGISGVRDRVTRWGEGRCLGIA